MILHLVNNEKIIDRTIDIFETVFPEENLFVICRKNDHSYIKKKGDNIIYIKEYEKLQSKFTISSVIIHSMTSKKNKFVTKYIKPSIPVYWIIWGSDLYDRLLEPKGYKLLDKESSYYKPQLISKALKSIYSIPKNRIRNLSRIKFIKDRVKYIITGPMGDDYEYLCKYYPQIRKVANKVFSYYPMDWIINSNTIDLLPDSKNIIIGNSADPTNNHEYVFRFLSKLDLGDRKLIVPLSYPSRKEALKYKDCVMKSGKELFDTQFEPLVDYLPLYDYNQLMSSCGIAIQGHWRQEAFGNILVSLYLGTKVFLSNKNPMYGWLLNANFKVFELEKITQQELDTPLSEIEKKHNRKIILDNFESKDLFEVMKSTFADR